MQRLFSEAEASDWREKLRERLVLIRKRRAKLEAQRMAKELAKARERRAS